MSELRPEQKIRKDVREILRTRESEIVEHLMEGRPFVMRAHFTTVVSAEYHPKETPGPWRPGQVVFTDGGTLPIEELVERSFQTLLKAKVPHLYMAEFQTGLAEIDRHPMRQRGIELLWDCILRRAL